MDALQAAFTWTAARSLGFTYRLMHKYIPLCYQLVSTVRSAGTPSASVAYIRTVTMCDVHTDSRHTQDCVSHAFLCCRIPRHQLKFRHGDSSNGRLPSEGNIINCESTSYEMSAESNSSDVLAALEHCSVLCLHAELFLRPQHVK